MAQTEASVATDAKLAAAMAGPDKVKLEPSHSGPRHRSSLCAPTASAPAPAYRPGAWGNHFATLAPSSGLAVPFSLMPDARQVHPRPPWPDARQGKPPGPR